ncbi:MULTISPECIES: DUF6232 family protein [unclassified Simplicispira]|uniref:DUF6232 family protein n=1 Tax=unclassified Simplicispira TaxID=2630407 RepID=UPI000D5E3C7B|nr:MULTISPECIES: DUF6232 family protein [unclassified Simplicispira]PVY57474.1 hypothetical protein C8D04_2764 [Simplicispira sp. 125]REG18418.1 hypothetical protein C8D01_3074 [Simplicispira sp. 110]
MEEKVFFELGSVKVTNARFVVDAQTFAMSNVTSVAPVTQAPSRFLLIFILIIGLMIVFTSVVWGIVVMAVAGALLYLQKTQYHIMLRTAGGETKALTTHEKDYFHQVVGALNEAIVHRG